MGIDALLLEGVAHQRASLAQLALPRPEREFEHVVLIPRPRRDRTCSSLPSPTACPERTHRGEVARARQRGQSVSVAIEYSVPGPLTNLGWWTVSARP